jgi:hypothetical protein
MKPSPHAADQGLLSRIERWAPIEAELWARWTGALSPEQRSEALLPLQAALGGLAAFRHQENWPCQPPADFRAHLDAVRATYRWALELIAELGVGATSSDPAASLLALQRSLTDALRVSNRLLDLPRVQADAFQASCDLFLRDLGRNTYFQPPGPLEFANVQELVGGQHLPVELGRWRSDAAKTMMVIAFLSLLRNHRFLGIADRQIGDRQGLHRAQVVVTGSRRDLRTLTRFLLVQGVETFADELEARLLALDARHIAEARLEITQLSSDLRALREEVEGLAVEAHANVRSALDDALLAPDRSLGLAPSSERTRNGIREVRDTLKLAAKRLRSLTLPTEREVSRPSERVPRDLRQDIWAFRFIVRAFLAKAAAASLRTDDWHGSESSAFVGEFVRHFRVFGPRLAKGTGYGRRGALMRAVGALGRVDGLDAETLDRAVEECELFAEHLDQAFEDAPQSLLAPFDKRKAAAELRDYLVAARNRPSAKPVPAGAFGLPDGGHRAAG